MKNIQLLHYGRTGMHTFSFSFLCKVIICTVLFLFLKLPELNNIMAENNAHLNQSRLKKVSGKVLDENGETMIGVTIMVKGTTIGVVTDVDGRFSIGLPNQKNMLKVSFIGYKPREVYAKNNMTIKMRPDMEALSEVVVVGYGTQKRSDITGSVSSVKPKEIALAPTSDVMESMQGRIAGLDITKTSGKIGEDVTILLRGSRSIYGNNAPLFIIDGQQGGDYSSVNPSDIASVDILKDASSTAIYGSAGSNGVIIITTKKGLIGKPVVNLNAYYGFSGNPEYKHGMTGDEWTDYMKEAYTYKMSAAPAGMSSILTNANYLAAYNNGDWIDWVDKASGNTATTKKINMSVRSGAKKTKVYISGSYEDQEGLLENDKQKKFQCRINIDQGINKYAKIGITSNLVYSDLDNGDNHTFTNALTAFPLGKATDEYGNINYEYIDNEYSPLGDFIKDQYVHNTKATKLNTNAFLEITPVKDLKYKSQISTTLNHSKLGQFWGNECNANIPTYASSPCAQITNNDTWAYTWDNIVNYKKTFLKNNKLDLTLVSSWTKNIAESSISEGSNQAVDSWSYYRLMSASGKYIYSDYTQYQKMGYALRLNYSYKSKYLLNFSSRYDGVSWLASGNKWAYFPAGALAWRISEEPFMEATRWWLNSLKLRAGYGVTGNDGGIEPYSTSPQTYWYTASGVTVNGKIAQFAQYTGTFSGADLTWEKSYNWNFGFDFAIIDNKIDGSVDYFNTDTKGLLFKRTLPVTSALTGWGSPLSSWQNIAKTNNHGIEIAINTHNFNTENFSWETNFTFSWEKEKIKCLPDGDLISGNLFEGAPINSFYGYKYEGIWKEDEADEAALYGCKPGYIKIQTLDKDGDGGVHPYSEYDRQILGHNNPDYVIGFNNTFRYKNFDLSIFAMARQGQMICSDLLGYYNAKYSVTTNQISGADYYTANNQDAYYPRPGTGDEQSTVYNCLKYRDGSFIKLKNVTLGYTIPKNISNKILMNKLRVYFTAYNPAIYVKDKQLKGTDPETNGSDSFPLYKQFVFGINTTF